MADKPSQLDAFLGASEPEALPDAKPEQDTAQPEAKPEPVAKPEPDADTEHDDIDPAGSVPASVMLQERKRRQDWKVAATKAETERDELRKQLDEAKRATSQPQQREEQQAPPPWINPAEDPQGFVARVQQVVLNERLNSSEMMLRREIGTEKVDAAIADFKEAAKDDPSLFPKLYSQADPYGWLSKHVEVLRTRKQIGDDPAAYIAKLRAEWEAERGAAAQEVPLDAGPPGAVLPRMAPSLATARSAAPRSSTAFSGPLSLDDILAGRKK